MERVLTLACLLAVANHVSAQCGSTQTYTETLIPQCASRDIRILWPNYKNQETYYRCDGINNPVEVSCPGGEYFSYVLQRCGTCDKYIPPVHCSQLRTQNTPNCVPIGEVSVTESTGLPSQYSYPTPKYPGKTSSSDGISQPTMPGTVSPPENGDTPATAQNTNRASVPTPPVAATSVAPPPSPFTNNPNVPLPPTPGPTPPSVQDVPPSIASR